MALILCPECGNQVSSRAAQCPYCGKSIGSDFTPLYKESAAQVVKNEGQQPSMDVESKERQTTLLQQLDMLRQESLRLQACISTDKNSLEQMRSEMENVEKELHTKQQTLSEVQSECEKEKASLDAIAASIQEKKNALEQLTVQIDNAQKTLKKTQQPSLGYRLAIWGLCIAIVATIVWILWMVITVNK